VERKLRVLPRMGAKLEEKVLRSIAQYRQRSGRYLLSYAEAVAAELIEALGQVPGVDAITPAGSLRRGRETVGDLDLLVTGPAAHAALERFVKYPRVEEVLGRGENKASAKVGREGLQVDVRALAPANFGAALQYFTGSKDHNVAIRTRAVKMGLKLSEYGLFRVEGDIRVAGETEAGVYEGLGLPWIPPELRENCGEIEAAEEGRLIDLAVRSALRVEGERALVVYNNRYGTAHGTIHNSALALSMNMVFFAKSPRNTPSCWLVRTTAKMTPKRVPANLSLS